MAKLSLASFADLGLADLGWGHPKASLFTNGVEVGDLRGGLREGHA